jgi:hypothetical protein
MNQFIGLGKIADIAVNGRVLKFDLAIQQEKPCFVPCILFDPTDEVKEYFDQLQTKQQVVWLQGRVAMNEFEYQGRTIRKIQVITYANGVKAV